MTKVPYSRVTDVNLSRTDNFTTRRGFGTQLILTETAVAGEVDGTKRTKLYSSIDEVAADFASGTDVHDAALAAFSRQPRPKQLKVGHIVTANVMDAAGLASELDAIANYDSDFYMITIEAGMRDSPNIDGLVSWVESKFKIAMIDSNDAGHEDPANTTCLSARHKGTVENSAVFYHTDANANLASSIAAYMATRNFDERNSKYTAKFKDAPGINAVNLGTSAITAITGFVPGIGQSEAAGHCANTLVDIGNKNFLVEGSTLTQNVFIDEIHATHWIISRCEEEALSLYLNNDAIQFTDQGMQLLASVPRAVMQAGVRAGLVATDLNPATGEYEPAFTVDVPSVFDVSESQRKSRIAPAIEVRFRAAGAVHYNTINLTMSF